MSLSGFGIKELWPLESENVLPPSIFGEQSLNLERDVASKAIWYSLELFLWRVSPVPGLFDFYTHYILLRVGGD